MKLSEAIQNYEIYKIIQRVKNKKGKIEEIEKNPDDVDGEVEGRVGIRNVNVYTIVPIERLVFVLNEVKEDDC